MENLNNLSYTVHEICFLRGCIFYVAHCIYIYNITITHVTTVLWRLNASSITSRWPPSHVLRHASACSINSFQLDSFRISCARSNSTLRETANSTTKMLTYSSNKIQIAIRVQACPQGEIQGCNSVLKRKI